MPPLPFFPTKKPRLCCSSFPRPIEPALRIRAFPDAVAEGDQGASKRAGPRPPDRAADSAAVLDAAAAFAQRDGARAPRPRRLKGEAPNWNTTGDAAIYRLSSVLAFSHQPAWG